MVKTNVFDRVQTIYLRLLEGTIFLPKLRPVEVGYPPLSPARLYFFQLRQDTLPQEV